MDGCVDWWMDGCRGGGLDGFAKARSCVSKLVIFFYM